jgi:hypothetical protein
MVQVIDDWSSLPSPSAFWKKMRATNNAYFLDENGKEIKKMVDNFKDMKNDHFRGLAWSVREAGGFIKRDDIHYFE